MRMCVTAELSGTGGICAPFPHSGIAHVCDGRAVVGPVRSSMPGNQAMAAKALSSAAMRSSTFSMPMERRMVFGRMP